MTEAADRVPALRKAHAVYERFRRSGRPAPFRIRVLDARYHAQFRKPRPGPRRATRPLGSPLVAAAIRQAREAAGMSRPRLAAVLKVTPKAVEHWERARRSPSEDNWVQLELALGPLGVAVERDRDAGQDRQRGDEQDAA